MKKILLLAMTVILCLLPAMNSLAMTADSEPFDPAPLEGVEGYEYDKFSKTWVYHHTLTMIDEGTMKAGGIELRVNSFNNAPVLAITIRAVMMDVNTRSNYAVEGIDLLIDDVIYRYEKLGQDGSLAYTYIGEQGMQLVRALAEGSSLSVRIRYSEGNFDYDVPAGEYNKTLKRTAQTILQYDLISFSADTTEVEKMVPLEIIR